MNYFELFKLPVQFELDTHALEQKYHHLQRLYHPDRFAMHNNQEQLAAAQWSAAINDGYQKLRTPLLRAAHLLELAGYPIDNEQQTFQDPEFLMQQIQWQEALESLEEKAYNPKEIETLYTSVLQQEIVFMQQLKDTLNQQQWQQAVSELRKLKFIDKLKAKFEALEDVLLK